MLPLLHAPLFTLPLIIGLLAALLVVTGRPRLKR